MRTLELILLVAALARANAQTNAQKASCSASMYATLYLRCDGGEVGDSRGPVCANQKELEVGETLSFKVTVSNGCNLVQHPPPSARASERIGCAPPSHPTPIPSPTHPSCAQDGAGVKAAVGNGQYLGVYYACAQGSECATADDI